MNPAILIHYNHTADQFKIEVKKKKLAWLKEITKLSTKNSGKKYNQISIIIMKQQRVK